MREVVLDTETTGLDPNKGHRIVEIGCIELVNLLPTGERFHRYVDPERDMPEDAFRVHGLSQSFLRQYKPFAAIARELAAFLGDSPLVIHNAEFDLKFLDWEFRAVGLPPIDRKRSVDTLRLAQRRFPGAQASLDALCRRYGIDNSDRSKHGALIDAELLAKVYLELRGGRQPGLGLADAAAAEMGEDGPDSAEGTPSRARVLPPRQRIPRPRRPSEEELAAHTKLLAKLTNSIWAQLLEQVGNDEPRQHSGSVSTAKENG